MEPLSVETVARRRKITDGQVRQLQERRGLTPEMLDAMPDEVLKRTLGRLQFHDLPRARHAFRRAQATDEHGQVPLHALHKALQQNRGFAERQAGNVAGVPTGPQPVRGALPPPVAGLNPDHTGWTSLGPGNIGGRIRSILIDPRNSNRLWAGSVGGGVWESLNGGASWQPVNDFLANLAVCCMAIDPSNPDTIYAGTGEGFYNTDAIQGAGVFITRDATNWSQLAGTLTPDFLDVNRIAVSANGAVVLAATSTGVFRSADPARATWTKVVSGDAAFVACHPSDPNRAVAGGRQAGAIFSIDGGQTWSASAGGPWNGRVELAYAAQNPSIVYASLDVSGGQIWRSNDGGQTFIRQNSQTASGQAAAYLGNQGWYGNAIWAGDPTNADLVLVGGVNLWRSTDGGNTLIDISTWWDPRSCHADHHRIVSDPL